VPNIAYAMLGTCVRWFLYACSRVIVSAKEPSASAVVLPASEANVSSRLKI